MIGVEPLLLLLAGERIVIDGGFASRVMFTTELPMLPAASLQAIVKVFRPTLSETVVGEVAALPFTVHPVTPTASVAVQDSATEVAAVVDPFAGETPEIDGGVTSGGT